MKEKRLLFVVCCLHPIQVPKCNASSYADTSARYRQKLQRRHGFLATGEVFGEAPWEMHSSVQYSPSFCEKYCNCLKKNYSSHFGPLQLQQDMGWAYPITCYSSYVVLKLEELSPSFSKLQGKPKTASVTLQKSSPPGNVNCNCWWCKLLIDSHTWISKTKWL